MAERIERFEVQVPNLANKVDRSRLIILRRTIFEVSPGWRSILMGMSLVTMAIISALIGHQLKKSNDFQSMVAFTDRNHDLSIEPEYNRQLRRIVVSLAKRDTTIELQHEMLAALPDYTRIILLLPETNAELIKSKLGDKDYRDRVEFVTYNATSLKNSQIWMLFPEKEKFVEVVIGVSDTESHNGSIWAQDLFEVMTDSSGRTLLVQPLVHKWFSMKSDEPIKNITPDNFFSKNLSKVGLETLTVPLSFFGGNVLIDKMADGQRIAFCGADMLATTRIVRTAIAEKHPADEQIIEDLKGALNVDQVVIPGVGQIQPYLMFHLDQAMLLLSDNVVAIPKVVGSLPEKASEAEEIMDVERFLASLRSQMMKLGYQLVDLEISVENLLHCQHYVNAIPYINAETSQKTVLMPIFRSAQADSDKELIIRNTERLESLGYEVVYVPTIAERLRGGIHCLINVLD